MDYIEIQSTSFPEQKEQFTELGRLFSQKLWHQLSVKLEAVAVLPFFLESDHLVRLHENFVSKFAKSLDPLRFARFACSVAKQYKDTASSLAFLESVLGTVKDEEAGLLLKMSVADRKVDAGEWEEAKAMLQAGKKTLDGYSGVMSPLIYSHFCLASMHYHKEKGPAADYFKNAMLFLTYTPLASIPVAEQVQLAADVGMAALTGDSIYNFGELLQHEVLKAIKGTQHEWLSDLLFIFNKGDLAGFKKLFAQQKGKHKQLKDKEEFLNEKIRLMKLMELVFQRGSANREMGFSDVAEVCELGAEQVELLLMRSFSLGLCKGEIDQVASKVRMSWVQPRVLDLEQVGSLRDRLTEWSQKTHDTTLFLEDSAPELINVPYSL